MADRSAKEQLRKDIATWFADGIIEKHTLGVLNERYESRRFGWIGVVKYLGIAGGMLVFFGIITLIAAVTESESFRVVVMGAIGGGLTYWGLRLAKDVQDRYAISSKVVVTLGVALWTSAIGMLSNVAGFDKEAVLTITGLVNLPIAFYLAYRNHNTYLLVVALLGMFHWIGAWNEMWGRAASEVPAQQFPGRIILPSNHSA